MDHQYRCFNRASESHDIWFENSLFEWVRLTTTRSINSILLSLAAWRWLSRSRQAKRYRGYLDVGSSRPSIISGKTSHIINGNGVPQHCQGQLWCHLLRWCPSKFLSSWAIQRARFVWNTNWCAFSHFFLSFLKKFFICSRNVRSDHGFLIFVLLPNVPKLLDRACTLFFVDTRFRKYQRYPFKARYTDLRWPYSINAPESAVVIAALSNTRIPSTQYHEHLEICREISRVNWWYGLHKC